MTKSGPVQILFVICLLFAIAKSDVPPDPGYTRQTASLTLETSDDLSDYRFFIESPMRIEEISIVKGEPTFIDGTTRVGAARIGTVWAIPRTTMGDDWGSSAPEKLQDMRRTLQEGRMYRAAKLLTHDFQTTLREEEKARWKDPVYRLEKGTEKGVVATLISGGQVAGSSKGFQIYSNEPKTPLFWATVIGGALLSLSLIFLGVWAVRRSKRKVEQA